MNPLKLSLKSQSLKSLLLSASAVCLSFASTFSLSQPAFAGTQALADGTYLYSNASQPGQVGREYVVIEKRGGQVRGVFYQPRSEYACFWGTSQSQQLNLAVIGVGDVQSVPLQANLSQYPYQQRLSASDRSLLSACGEVRERLARSQGAPQTAEVVWQGLTQR